MNGDYENEATSERISALIDGESATPAADADWVRADAARHQQYRQYQTLGNLLRGLSPPQVSDAFAADTVLLITMRRRYRPYAWMLAAAAAMLLVSGALIALISLMSDNAVEIMAYDEPATFASPYDETDYHLWQLMNDARGGMDMEDVMAFFDTVSEEALLEALAMLEAPVPDDWTMPGATPVVSIYALMDDLDDVERIAVDELLQDLLT